MGIGALLLDHDSFSDGYRRIVDLRGFMLSPELVAVVMAGGAGTRFWPLSRRRRPKQLLPFAEGRSLLSAAVERLLPLVPPSQVVVVTGAGLAEAVRTDLPLIPPQNVLAEPTGRDTAACIGWVAWRLAASLPNAPPVVPADHVIPDDTAFGRPPPLPTWLAVRRPGHARAGANRPRAGPIPSWARRGGRATPTRYACRKPDWYGQPSAGHRSVALELGAVRVEPHHCGHPSTSEPRRSTVSCRCRIAGEPPLWQCTTVYRASTSVMRSALKGRSGQLRLVRCGSCRGWLQCFVHGGSRRRRRCGA